VSRPVTYGAVGLVAAVVGGGIFAEIALDGKHPGRIVHPKAQVHARGVGPAHGLMLIPLADPDGRVHR